MDAKKPYLALVKEDGDKVFVQKIEQILDYSSIEEIQAYLKTKGLGTFNLSLDFHYYENENN